MFRIPVNIMSNKREIEAFPNTDPGKFLITLEKHTTVYSEDDSKIPVDFGETAQIQENGNIQIELESAWKLKEKYELTELEAKRLVLTTLSHEVEHYNSSELDSKRKIVENWPQCPKLAGDIMNIVEDCYIDNKRLKKFEGLQKPERIKKEDFYSRTQFNGDISAENMVLATAYVFLCDRRPETDSEFYNKYCEEIEVLKRQAIKADKQEERVNIAEKVISTILDNVEIPENLDTPDFEDFEGMEGKAEEVEEEEERNRVKMTVMEIEELEEEREEEASENAIEIDIEVEEEENEEEEEDSDADSENNESSDSDSEDEDSESSESGSEPSPNSEDDGDGNNESNSDSSSGADSEEESENDGSSSSESEDSDSSDSDSEEESENDGSSTGTPKEDSDNHNKKKRRENSKDGGREFNIDTDRFVAKAINGGTAKADVGVLNSDDVSEIEHESELLSDDVKEVLEEMDDDRDMDYSVNKESGAKLDVKKSVRYLSGDKSQRDIYRVNREDRPDKRTIGVTIDASGSMSGKGMKQALQSTTALAIASRKLGDEFIANTHWSDMPEGWSDDRDYWKEHGMDTDVTWITKAGEEFDISALEDVNTRWREPIALGIKETRAEMQKSRKKGDNVLFVIHDGNPTITTDGLPLNHRGICDEAVQEVAEEVEKCRKLGFKVIGLAVGDDMEEDALNDMFGRRSWFKYDMDELPTEILRIYREETY